MKKFLLIATLSLFYINSSAQVYYVRSNASGANNGSSWANAFTTIQPAIDAASLAGGGQVWVTGGTYNPTAGTDRSASFVLKNGVALYGGFAGSETQFTQRNFTTNQTILSGEIGNGSVTDNSYHVITNSGTLDNSAVLDGFSVTRGYADDAALGGGGLFVTNAGMIIRNCIFFLNTAATGKSGGAMVVNGNSNFKIVNCKFYSNLTITAGGGAVYINAGNAEIVNSEFYSNQGAGGSAIQTQAALKVINCTLSKNNAYGNAGNNGGAILNGGVATVTIHNSILWANTSFLTGREEVYANNGGSFDGTNNILSGSNTIGTGTLNTDPLFQGASANNFKVVLACSPAINSANASVIPAYATTDLAGKGRSVYGVPDRGAYEMSEFSSDYTGHISLDCHGAELAITFGPSSTATGYQVGSFTTSTNTISVPAGTYEIRALQSGCSQSFKFADITINQPAQLQSGTPVAVMPSCKGDTNGSITFSGSGGTPPYSYRVDGVTTSYFQNNSTGIFTGLSAGQYEYSVFDSNGCGLDKVMTLAEPGLLQPSITPVNISCFGRSDGAASVTAIGGTGPFTYSFNGGAYGSTSTFSSLAIGNYSISVRDTKGCTASGTFSIAQPTVLSVTASIVNGFELQASGAGGTSPYEYSLNGTIYQSSTVFTDIGNGSYTIHARDSRGCTATTQQTFLITGIDELAALTVFPNPTISVIHLDGLSGTEQISVTDPQGKVLVARPAIKGLNEIDVSGWQAGLYVLTVSDHETGNKKVAKILKR